MRITRKNVWDRSVEQQTLDRIYGGLIALVSIITGAFGKLIYHIVDNLRNDHNNLSSKTNSLEVKMAQDYVSKRDFERTVNKIDSKLDYLIEIQIKRGS